MAIQLLRAQSLVELRRCDRTCVRGGSVIPPHRYADRPALILVLSRRLRSVIPGTALPLLWFLATCTIFAGCGKSAASSSTPTLASIAVTPALVSVAVNGTEQFSAAATDSSGNAMTGLTFAWTSNTTSVMTINSSSGLATAVTSGTTQITASANGVTSPPDVITVVSVASIAVTPSPALLAANGTQQFSATAKDLNGNTITSASFTWASSATNVVSINASTGLATGLALGTAQVTASADGVTSPPVTAAVDAVATITVTPSPASVAVNGTQQFSAVAKDSNGALIAGTSFTWASSAPAVASIDSVAGLATGVGLGAAQITASANGVTSAPVTLMVLNPQGELDGQYALLLQGFDDATSNRFAIIGSFTADGNGNITNGVEDINGPAGYQAAVTFQGTYTVGLDNRGTATTSNSLGVSNTFNFSLGALTGEVATAGNIIEFDDPTGATGERGTGEIHMQNASNFGLSSINGPYALQFSGQQASAGSWYVNTGSFIADGRGNLTNGELDTNNAMGALQNGAFAATLAATSNTSANGRLTFVLTSGGQTTGVFYIVSHSQLLFMETDPESTAGLEAGQVLAQTSSAFSNASLNSIAVEYEVGLGSTAAQPSAAVGFLTFNGTGSATFSRDYSSAGTTTTQAASLSYSVAANGRVIVQQAGAPFVYLYLVDTNKGFIMSAGNSATRGFFEQQAAGPFSTASISGNYFLGNQPPPVTPMAAVSGVLTAANGIASFTQDVSSKSGLFIGETGSTTLTVAANGRATDNVGINNNDVYYIISATKFLLLVPAGPTAPAIDIVQQ